MRCPTQGTGFLLQPKSWECRGLPHLAAVLARQLDGDRCGEVKCANCARSSATLALPTLAAIPPWAAQSQSSTSTVTCAAQRQQVIATARHTVLHQKACKRHAGKQEPCWLASEGW